MNFHSWARHMILGICIERKVAFIMGVDRHGELFGVFMPLSVYKMGLPKGFVANFSNLKKNLSIVMIDVRDFGMGYVYEDYAKIPEENRPKKPLEAKWFAGTHLEDASKTKSFGLCLMSTNAPGLNGQLPIQANIDDSNAIDSLAKFSPKHGRWAELMCDMFSQYRNEQEINTRNAILQHIKETPQGFED